MKPSGEVPLAYFGGLNKQDIKKWKEVHLCIDKLHIDIPHDDQS